MSNIYSNHSSHGNTRRGHPSYKPIHTSIQPFHHKIVAKQPIQSLAYKDTAIISFHLPHGNPGHGHPHHEPVQTQMRYLARNLLEAIPLLHGCGDLGGQTENETRGNQNTREESETLVAEHPHPLLLALHLLSLQDLSCGMIGIFIHKVVQRAAG